MVRPIYISSYERAIFRENILTVELGFTY